MKKIAFAFCSVFLLGMASCVYCCGRSFFLRPIGKDLNKQEKKENNVLKVASVIVISNIKECKCSGGDSSKEINSLDESNYNYGDYREGVIPRGPCLKPLACFVLFGVVGTFALASYGVSILLR